MALHSCTTSPNYTYIYWFDYLCFIWICFRFFSYFTKNYNNSHRLTHPFLKLNSSTVSMYSKKILFVSHLFCDVVRIENIFELLEQSADYERYPRRSLQNIANAGAYKKRTSVRFYTGCNLIFTDEFFYFNSIVRWIRIHFRPAVSTQYLLRIYLCQGFFSL